MSDLRKRWGASEIASILVPLKQGLLPISPFGKTNKGSVDLRGIPLKEPLLLSDVSFDNLDLSFSNIQKLLSIRCSFVDCSFEGATVSLLNNESGFYRVDFSRAEISKSGSAGAAKFFACNFNGSDLTGGNFKTGSFENCDFSRATIKLVEFGECEISDSIFDGNFKKCFFRGLLSRCDFRAAVFIDCAFYGVELNDCLLSKDMILFKNWMNCFVKICQSVEADALSDVARNSLDKWCAVWQQLKGVVRDEVIDYQNLKEQEGREVADELFAFFKAAAINSSRT